MTRKDLLRRTVILCCHFMRNLAYYRTGWQHPLGWTEPPLERTASFWRTVNGNFIDTCVLEWCKLLGDAKGQHCWEQVASDKVKFKAELLKYLGINDMEFESFRLKMREYRDKFIAHLDSEAIMNIPTLNLAKASVEFYHAYVVCNEAQPGDLSGLPDSADKLRHGYDECVNEAEATYRKFFAATGQK